MFKKPLSDHIVDSACSYRSDGYVTNDCSSKVATLYKNGLPLGSLISVTAGPIQERMSNLGMQKYRVYKITANIPLKDEIIWTAATEADSEYMYIQEDPRMIINDLLGYGGANPDYAINMDSLQDVVQVLLKDYKGKGPVDITISPTNLTISVKTPEGQTFTSALDLELKIGNLRIIKN